MSFFSKPMFFILVAVLVAGLIVFLSWYFNKAAMIRRKLKKLPLRKISGFPDGEVGKISGTVELTGPPLTAPLSGRKCGYYKVVVEQMVSNGKSSHWKKLIEEEVAGPFGIRDGMYCARVEGEGIVSLLVEDRKFSSGFMEDATETLERFLKKYGKESESFFGMNKKLRYLEGVLEEGERVVVMGTAKREHAESGAWSDEYGKVLVFRASKESPVYLSDEPSLCTSV